MPFFEAIRLALQTIRAQKLKSTFSIIGVFIGVMFLIAVVSVVQGMNRYMTDKFAGTILGVNTFRLRQFPDVQLGNITDSTWRVWRRRPRVTYDDAQAVARGVTIPVLAAWESSTRAALTAGRKQAKDVQVTAATEPYFDIRSLHLLSGKGAALPEPEGTDVEIRLRGRRDLHILRLLPAGGERRPGARLPRREHWDGPAARHGLRVVVGHPGAPAPHPPRRVRDVAELHVGELTQPERVHTEDRAGELVRHVAVHPLHDGDDGDEEHHADEHADDGKGALQLLRPDGLQGEADGLEEGHLFVSQRLDRIEPRRFTRRIEPEQDARQRCDDQRHHDRGERHVRWDGRRYGQTDGREAAADHSHDAADERERGRLDEELPQDLAPRRSQRLAHPDFAGALGDRDHHDRDHPHAAHDQPDGGQNEQHEPNDQGHAVEVLEELLLTHDREVVVLARAQMTSQPQRLGDVLHRLSRRRGRGGADQQVHPALPIAHVLDQGAMRDDRFGRRLAPEQLRRRVEHADDGVRDALDADALADRVDLVEQQLGQLLVDDDDLRGGCVLHLGEGTPWGNVSAGDVGPRRAPPKDAHAVLGLRAERDVRLPALVQGHPAHRGQARDGLGVGERDRRVVAPRAHFVRAVGDDDTAREEPPHPERLWS